LEELLSSLVVRERLLQSNAYIGIGQMLKYREILSILSKMFEDDFDKNNGNEKTHNCGF